MPDEANPSVVSPEELAEAAGASIEAALRKARASSAMYESDSLRWTIGDTVEKIADVASKSVAITDKYGNALASVGTDDQVAGFSTYGFSADTLQWPLWLALYNDSWVFKRLIDKPAQDAVSAGFILKNNRDCSEAMAVYDQLKPQVAEMLQWAALFGGSIGVMLFSGISFERMASPMVRSELKGKKMRLYATDRWYGVSPSLDDLVQDFGDPDFGKPKYYDVTLADGKTHKLHHSWCIRCEGRPAPPLIKQGYLQGWGYAEGAHVISELARDDQLKSSITSLVNKALIEVIKMAGMRGVFMGTDKGNEVQLRKRLEMVNWGRTYNSLTFLDKDDEYQQYQLTGLSGLAELLEKNMWMIAAAMEMQGVLFGDLKGGLSQETDAWQRYSQTIHGRAERLARPAWQKLMSAIFAVCGYKGPKGGALKPKLEVSWLDREDREKRRADNISAVGGMLSKLEQDGVISKRQYAETIGTYASEGRLSLSFPEEILNKLKLEEEQAILETIKSISKKKGGDTRLPGSGGTFPGTPSSPSIEPSASEYEEEEEDVVGAGEPASAGGGAEPNPAGGAEPEAGAPSGEGE